MWKEQHLEGTAELMGLILNYHLLNLHFHALTEACSERYAVEILTARAIVYRHYVEQNQQQHEETTTDQQGGHNENHL